MIRNLLLERRRAKAVRGLALLNTPAEPGFDRFVEQAAAAFAAPIALMSLIHGDQQWFKAGHGVVLDCISRRSGFCGFALDRPDLLESCDPLADPRFAQLPSVVGEPHVRYYIGAPLRLTSGTDVGALCVLDVARREPALPDQRAYLVGLARQAARAMEARSAALPAGTAA